jgi:hypothetical protein
MNRTIEARVLIVGAGPVGLTLAIDLAWRGVDVTVAELRAAGEAPSVKCNVISSRSMDIDVELQCCTGLNFGYFYERSPIIAYDGEQQPAYTMSDFTPSSVPGCRAPHIWLADHRSLYDTLDAGYTLIRLDPGVRVSGLTDAARRRGVPLGVLDVDAPEARALYRRNLVLVRPDQHVAWRGDKEPSGPLDLIDLVRGARTTPRGKRVLRTQSIDE